MEVLISYGAKIDALADMVPTNELPVNEVDYEEFEEDYALGDFMVNALHIAARFGGVGAVALLLDNGIHIDSTSGLQDEQQHLQNSEPQQTALIFALEYRQEWIVKLLVERGANPNAVSSADKTTLDLALHVHCVGNSYHYIKMCTLDLLALGVDYEKTLNRARVEGPQYIVEALEEFVRLHQKKPDVMKEVRAIMDAGVTDREGFMSFSDSTYRAIDELFSSGLESPVFDPVWGKEDECVARFFSRCQPPSSYPVQVFPR
jgi:hypothetical protein